jgi:hypothetical protein
MLDAAPTKRRWHQFSLKWLFVLVAIVAVASGWFKSMHDQRQRERVALAAIYASGGAFSTTLFMRQVPKWKLKLFGRRYFYPVTGVSFSGFPASDADMRNVAVIGTLESVCLEETDVTDAGLEELKVLTNLKELDLSGARVTDHGIAEFRRALPNCKIIR